MSTAIERLALNDARTKLQRALSEMTDAVYQGTDDERKAALTHLLDAWRDLYGAAETVLSG